MEKAKLAAEEANRTKSQFLASMSHELRTPLNAIIGYSEMLQEDAEDAGDADRLSDLKKIHTAGTHLLTLINDILDLSKIEAGRIELYLEDFDVRGLIDDVATTVAPLVEKNANQLTVTVGPDVNTMHADVTRLRQVLLNLLSNASKFTKEGVVKLDVQRRIVAGRPCLEFAVADSGIGMTPEQMSKLFQSFTQADASTTRKFGGTGLGLVISRRFCQMMSGDISVKSTPGFGSTFIARIPLEVKEQVRTTGERLAPPLSPPAPAPMKTLSEDRDTILVIDDDPVVLDLLKNFLTKEGYQVVTASRGEDGLMLARHVKPVAITLDVMMPTMDGWSVLTALKSDPAVMHIPVIMLTVVEDKNHGFALGASDYLHKPIDRERLVQVLAKYDRDRHLFPVLLVEDDAGTRDLMRRMLRKEGWSVVEAENGRVALEQMKERPPALILLDLTMPEMDGFSFLMEMRKTEAWRHIPVVVVTARDLGPDDKLRLNGYVEKVLQKGAYHRDELLSDIRMHLAACVKRA
jgi:CheY-like chemotaxis protein